MDADALYLDGYHFMIPTCLPDGITQATPCSRTDRYVKYYFFDFGLSSMLDSTQQSLVTGTACGGRFKPPELSQHIPYNPFKVDIFMLGGVYLEQLLNVSHLIVRSIAILMMIVSRNT